MGKSESDFQEEDYEAKRRIANAYGTLPRKSSPHHHNSRADLQRRSSLATSLSGGAIRGSAQELWNPQPIQPLSPPVQTPSPVAQPPSEESSLTESQTEATPWDSGLDSSMMEFEEDGDSHVLQPSTSYEEPDALDEEALSLAERKRTYRLSRFFGEKMDSNKLGFIQQNIGSGVSMAALLATEKSKIERPSSSAWKAESGRTMLDLHFRKSLTSASSGSLSARAMGKARRSLSQPIGESEEESIGKTV